MVELGNAQKEAFAALVVSTSKVIRRIDRELVEAGGLAPELYDVLLSLEHASDGKMRMGDLAEAVVLTPSGITRLVDKLEAVGMVKRAQCPADRRSTYAIITPEGIKRRAEAWPAYRDAIQKNFGTYLTESEAITLRELIRKTIPGVLVIGTKQDEAAINLRRAAPHQ